MTATSCLKSDSEPIRPLPFHAYFLTLLGLGIVGLLISTYLAYSHYHNYTDLGYQSFCALSKAINCDTVSQSSYSVLWNLPVAIWGVVGYLFFLILSFFGLAPSVGHRRIWSLCFAVAVAFSLASAAFAWISMFRIRSYCILCIGTYAINFLLVYFSWIIRRRFQIEPIRPAIINDIRFLIAKRNVSVPVFLWFAVGLMLSVLFFPDHWNVRILAEAADVKTGMTSDGHPWIGAENPALEIVEFADYLCFQCKKMHHHLRKLVAQHPDAIRLIHRNYPMDHQFNPIVAEPFHEGAGKMAILAIHAAAIGKFWAMNDTLFNLAGADRRIDLNETARQAGMDSRTLAAALEHGPYLQRLLFEIRDGMKLGIVGTPSYLVNGKIYEGGLPPEVLASILGQRKK